VSEFTGEDTPELPRGRECNSPVCRPYLLQEGIACRRMATEKFKHVPLCPRHYHDVVSRHSGDSEAPE
jgi:hypothetical protein